MEIKNTTPSTTSSLGKVDGPRAEKIKELSGTAGSRKSLGTNPKGDGYTVAVSSEAQELTAAHAKAFEIAKNTSPIREKRVAELKSQIEAGTYKVDSGNIADGMLREAIRDKLATSE